MISIPISRQRLGRAIAALADQILSSGSNFALIYAASLLLSVSEFSDFVVAMSFFVVVSSVVRGFIGEPLLAVLPRLDDVGRARATGDAARVGIVIGGGILCLSIALLMIPGPTGAALFWMAIWAPAALLQDIARFAMMAIGRVLATLFIDAVWIVVQTAALLAIIKVGDTSVATITASWGVGAMGSVVAAAVVLQPALRGARVRRCLVASKASAGWLAGGSLLAQLQQPYTLLLIGAGLTVESAGAFRAMQLLVLPLAQIVMSASIVVLVPVFASALANGSLRGRSAGLLTGVCAVAGVAVVGGIIGARQPLVAAIFPAFAGSALLLIPLGMQALAFFIVIPWMALLRAGERGRTFIAAQIVSTALLAVGMLPAVFNGNLTIAAWVSASASACWAGWLTIAGVRYSRTLRHRPRGNFQPPRRICDRSNGALLSRSISGRIQ